MSDVAASLRRLVIERAAGRCEYCQLAQAGQEAVFHIDHVKPRVAGGPTTLENLALACVSCSLRKAARTHAPDPDNGTEVSLFNPRSQRWNEHFQWQGEIVSGVTATGRATIAALAMNRPLITAIRKEQAAQASDPRRG